MDGKSFSLDFELVYALIQHKQNSIMQNVNMALVRWSNVTVHTFPCRLGSVSAAVYATCPGHSFSCKLIHIFLGSLQQCT